MIMKVMTLIMSMNTSKLINQKVYDLYGLTEEEIKIVESN